LLFLALVCQKRAHYTHIKNKGCDAQFQGGCQSGCLSLSESFLKRSHSDKKLYTEKLIEKTKHRSEI